MEIDYSSIADGTAINIPICLIDDFPGGNVRRARNPQKFEELCRAVKQAGGVTQGVTVRPNPDNPDRLQLLAGYGRRDAATKCGFDHLPGVLKQVDDKKALAIMLSENKDREDLSIADEIIAAARYVSLYDGDYTAAASDLGWSEFRVRQRLTLRQCSDRVLDALFDEKIELGHAVVLAPFTEKLQNGTLEKIVSEGWSVEKLKERAGKATRMLRQAIFDKADCSACPHNSSVQSSLFDDTVGKDKCSNLECFRAKTDVALEQKKALLAEEHGVVLLASEKPESDRNTTNADQVGAEQFANGCTGCVSNAVILKGGINRDAGEILTNQCIDTDCFRKLKNAHIDKTREINSSQNPKSKIQNNSKKKGNAVAAKGMVKNSSAASVQKTPGTVLNANRKYLRNVSWSLYKNDPHFMEAISVASMIEQTSCKRSVEKFGVKSEKGVINDFDECVIALFQLSEAELLKVKTSVYTWYCEEEVAEEGGNPETLMLKALAIHKEGKQESVASWVPDKPMLSRYLKGGIESIARQAGFDVAFDKVHGENAFDKLCKKTKAPMIDEIVAFDFNWIMFAPDDYLGCIPDVNGSK